MALFCLGDRGESEKLAFGCCLRLSPQRYTADTRKERLSPSTNSKQARKSEAEKPRVFRLSLQNHSMLGRIV